MTDTNYYLTLELFNNLDSISNIFSPLSLMIGLTAIHTGAFGRTNNQLVDILGTKYQISDLEKYPKIFNNSCISIETLVMTNDAERRINPLFPKLSNRISPIIDISRRNNRSILNRHHLTLPSLNTLTLFSNCKFCTNWEIPFDPNLTYSSAFSSKSDNSVQMMMGKVEGNYYKDKFIQLIEIPIENDCIFGIILPVRKKEREIEYSINDIPLIEFSNLLEYVNNTELIDMEIHLPKFTHRQHTDLKTVFQKLGLFDIFDDNADLSMIAPGIYLSNIIQDSVIVVDEGNIREDISSQNQKPNDKTTDFLRVKVDRPFLFYVRYVPDNILIAFGDYHGYV